MACTNLLRVGAQAALVGALTLATACSNRKPSADAPMSPSPIETLEQERLRRAEAEEQVTRLKSELEEVLEKLEQNQRAEAEKARELKAEFARAHLQLTSLQSSYSTLLAELSDALDEIGRLREGLPSVQSRAFAVSLIADARVRLDSLRPTRVPEATERRESATELLVQADKALQDGNYGAACYLAQRAREAIRTTRVPVGRVEPLDEPMALRVTSTANLRSGPSTDHRRLGSALDGENLTALARMDEWFQVQTESGLLAWIHRSLVTLP